MVRFLFECTENLIAKTRNGLYVYLNSTIVDQMYLTELQFGRLTISQLVLKLSGDEYQIGGCVFIFVRNKEGKIVKRFIDPETIVQNIGLKEIDCLHVDQSLSFDNVYDAYKRYVKRDIKKMDRQRRG